MTSKNLRAATAYTAARYVSDGRGLLDLLLFVR